MRIALLTVVLTSVALLTAPMIGDTQETKPVPQALNFTVKDIGGKDVELGKYLGKVVLVVNVASKCGYTKQYAGLEALHEKYGEKGLAVLGFPCNQFGKQEPGTDAEIKEFCESTFNVKFDLFSKINVNDENAAPLYRYLTSKEAPVKDQGPVKWNFEKFLIGRDGNLIARFRSKAAPDSAEFIKELEQALAAK